MKRSCAQYLAVIAALFLVSVTLLESDALARAGGSRSFGSRGTRTYSRPAPAPSQLPPRQATPSPQPMSPPPFQQPAPATGGFFRSLAGGMIGGMLGGMLFRSLGFGGMGGYGGGPGLFDILLLAGICYLVYRFIKKRREGAETSQGYDVSYRQTGYQPPIETTYAGGSYGQPLDQVTEGLSHVRQLDYSFDENRFKDAVMDLFFKVQGAWMNRDLVPVAGILTEEMNHILQQDVDLLKRDRQINRLENIAVRSVEISEAWQESGQDYITAMIYANLLDYTTDESGNVVSGSKTDPVKFEEYWTFTRPVGNNPWKLSAIQQG